MPRLTIMEEILLLGLKDKQVRIMSFRLLLFIFSRAICRSGTTIYPTPCEGVSSSSSPFVDASPSYATPIAGDGQ